jgi:RNA polymerase sigma factor (sigma-70 family)
LLLDGADHQILAHDVAQAIADLPPPYRQVLVLRDVHDMTAPEVAATLGLTGAAVKSRLHRARAMVRATLTNGHGTHTVCE